MHDFPGAGESSSDVLIVGGGIAGAWAAKELCEAGLTVTIVEAGPSVQRGDHAAAQDWSESRRRVAAVRQPVQSRHPAYWMLNPAHFVDDAEHPYVQGGTEPFVWIRGRQVGGRSLTWGGITLRLSDQELGAAEQDGYGPSWPISHDDLAPFYAHVEEFLQIEGERDEVPQLPDGPFRAAPALTDAELRFRQSVESRWRDRRVLHSRGLPLTPYVTGPDHDGWSPLSMQYRVLPAALRTGCARIRPNSIVSNLVMSDQGDRVVGVCGVDRLTRERFELRGRVVALCASTIESIRILLNSRSQSAPQGVANSSGCLGRYLVDHACSVLAGRIPGEPLREPLPVGSAHGVIVPRFRNCNGTRESFVRGYGIWGNMGRVAWRDSGEALWTLCAMLEVLPQPGNRVQLDPGQRDAWGIPVPRIDFAYSENEVRMREDAERCMRQMVEPLGWKIEQQIRMAPGQFVHELGGARMGRDPRTSVLNPVNQSWDVRNLFVLDGACFVTAGWQNPTHTIMALAVRASRYIAEGFRRHDF